MTTPATNPARAGHFLKPFRPGRVEAKPSGTQGENVDLLPSGSAVLGSTTSTSPRAASSHEIPPSWLRQQRHLEEIRAREAQTEKLLQEASELVRQASTNCLLGSKRISDSWNEAFTASLTVTSPGSAVAQPTALSAYSVLTSSPTQSAGALTSLSYWPTGGGEQPIQELHQSSLFGY